MSAREWKPGDVAMVTAMNRDRFRATFDGEVWREHGDLTDWKGAFLIEPVDVRPLVVIDPEDREHVERFIRALDKRMCMQPDEIVMPVRLENFTAAFREFADPKPPKPEEPTGLGAVVEDAEGVDWHRTRGGRWISGDGLRSRGAGWPGIDVVRVLHKGVTS